MRVLSLFSGIAGLDLGIKIAVPEARVVVHVEADGYCQRVLAARMLDGSLDPCPIHGDVTTFDGRPWRGSVDTIAGGFPCQDISNAGRREGLVEGNRSGLWYEFARIIGEVRPRYVFVENVSALVIRGLDAVLLDLARLGYLAEWTIVSAAEVGAPHLRKRLFLLGVGQADSESQRGSESCTGDGRQVADDGERSLADAQRAERGPHALTRGGGGEGSNGQGEAGGRGDGPADGDRALANAANGAVLDLRGAGRDAGGAGPGRAGHAAAAGRGSHGEVGDAAGDLRGAPGDGGPDAPDGAGDLPLFPPGPADRAGWAAVLSTRPELAPAVIRSIRGVDPGVSHRVHRLKALGNAVVPAQAAAAFVELWERLNG